MKYELYTRMALSEGLPEHGLRRGDTVAVIIVRESQIAPLTADELMSVRPSRSLGRNA